MARVEISTIHIPDSTGVVVTYEAANADGNNFAHYPGRLVHVRNGGGSSIDLTIPTPGTYQGLEVADRVVTIDAGEDMFIGPFGSVYRQTDGTVHLDYSGVTSVTLAVLQL